MQSINPEPSDKEKEQIRKAQQLIHQNQPTTELQKQAHKEYEAPEYYKQMLTQEYPIESDQCDNES